MIASKYELMRHALGVHEHPRSRRGAVDLLSPRWKKPYRNHFVAGVDHVPIWMELVTDGFARIISLNSALTGGDPAFACTEAGKLAALDGIVFKKRWGYGSPTNR